MGTDTERCIRRKAGLGSDCGWVDRVQWTGTAGYVGPVPMPTEWDQISYTYDPAGRRIEKKYDTITVVKYVYDGSHCLAEYDGNNQLLRKYIYGPGSGEKSEARSTKSETNPKHELRTTKTGPPVGPAVWDFGFPSLGVVSNFDIGISNLPAHYYHFDALGSVIALSGADGNTAVLYEYSVYGQVAASDPNHPNRFLFTGREFDADTGQRICRCQPLPHPTLLRQALMLVSMPLMAPTRPGDFAIALAPGRNRLAAPWCSAHNHAVG